MARNEKAAAPADDTSAQAEFPDVAVLSYEDARDELISIVAQLEGGQSGLEESMRLWRRGEALAAHCSTWLDGAESALAEVDEARPGD
ncbi:exodeoxyribonuclease VII small subunit [Pedococcus sp. NPDC057267]|uniref:exodeoxyribonuclease VII small subunit n=1 Tax=Pedococcus sp. NPDC057267 TaxID=3346077 RepID=UPI0036301773